MTVESQHDIDGVLNAGRVVARVRDAMLRAVEPGMTLDGYFADTGGTTVVPPVARVKARLCHAARLALKLALAEARAGAPINRIGKAIQRTAKSHGFKVIKNLAGHGIGRSLHEEPEGIVSYFDRFDARRLKPGQVIAIEPFLSTKSTHVTEAGDGWTLVGHPANLSAQYEHTIIVTKGAPIVATLSEARG